MIFWTQISVFFLSWFMFERRVSYNRLSYQDISVAKKIYLCMVYAPEKLPSLPLNMKGTNLKRF